MFLALDDTDGPGGGCTTHTALALLEHLRQKFGLVLRGPPRLVRLNPNVPHKTRGNGAVAMELGTRDGVAVPLGSWNGAVLESYPDSRAAAPDHHVLEAAWAFIDAASQKDAQPGLVLAARPLPPECYDAAVKGCVTPDEARHAAGLLGVPHRFRGTGRSLAGCLGALAWPGPPASHELLAYRERSRWGMPRSMHEQALLHLDADGVTFHTSEADHVVAVPHGPDPVLVGLRGRDPARLQQEGLRALRLAAQEPIGGWCLWDTNHASGDHVTSVQRVVDGPRWGTISCEAVVAGAPESREGGHVFVRMTDAAGAGFEAAAFEPTGRLRHAVRALVPGDRVHIVGAYDDGLVRLEKLRVASLAAHVQKIANPDCPSCGKRMKSSGRDAPFRCRACGTEADRSAAAFADVARDVALGWHEPAVGARRHLHRPASWD